MPPAEAKKPLSNQQKQLLRQWIEQGAPYAEHWAFRTPERPALPDAEDHHRRVGGHFCATTLTP